MKTWKLALCSCVAAAALAAGTATAYAGCVYAEICSVTAYPPTYSTSGCPQFSSGPGFRGDIFMYAPNSQTQYFSPQWKSQLFLYRSADATVILSDSPQSWSVQCVNSTCANWLEENVFNATSPCDCARGVAYRTAVQVSYHKDRITGNYSYDTTYSSPSTAP